MTEGVARAVKRRSMVTLGRVDGREEKKALSVP